MRIAANLRPRLTHPVRFGAASIHIGDEYRIESADSERTSIGAVLLQLDGSATIADLISTQSPLPEAQLLQLIAELDEAGLIDDTCRVTARTGLEVFLDLDDWIDQLCVETIFQNDFWRSCADATSTKPLSERLAVGMVIENWHFLFRESYFDAPVLSYVPSTRIRLLLNQFFSEEYGHDDILLKALNFAGLSREDMMDAIPLPQTMALCNALAYWAHTDPLFFFATLGLLEGKAGKQDSFIDACERSGLAPQLVGPLKAHANININAAHGSLSRSLFSEIPLVTPSAERRLRRQARTFVDLYNAFYQAVWNYYTSDTPLLRRVSAL